MKSEKLTILSVTYNAEKKINILIDSLRSQSNKDFEWVIIDGSSTDNTVKILNSIRDIRIRLYSENDFGIYDALNKGVSKIESGYYLVLGADDFIYPETVDFYKEMAKKYNSDFIMSAVLAGNKIYYPRKNMGWLYGMGGISSGHSVGMIINVALHKKYGLYTKYLPIAADQLFVKSAIKGGASVTRLEKVVGEFGLEGLSNRDNVGYLTEQLRVQLETEKIITFQVFIFILRLIKLQFVKKFANFKFR